MVVRLHNVSKWSCLMAGHVLDFPGTEHRLIRVEVNCPEPTRFDLVDEKGNASFLAVVQGLEVLEFAAGGVMALAPTTDGEVWYYTAEGPTDATESIEASYLTIMQRRERNPALERFMWKQGQNMRRREAQLADEVAAFQAFRVQQAAAAGADEDGVFSNESEAGRSVGAGVAAPGTQSSAKAVAAASDAEAAGAANGGK